MTEIVLSGRLVCSNDEELAVVEKYLPRHIESTRAEPGCLGFSVVRTGDPLVWAVDERFADQGAFDMHQRRAAGSEWGLATAGIEREYTIRARD